MTCSLRLLEVRSLFTPPPGVREVWTKTFKSAEDEAQEDDVEMTVEGGAHL
jgi:hypothetical protein